MSEAKEKKKKKDSLDWDFENDFNVDDFDISFIDEDLPKTRYIKPPIPPKYKTAFYSEADKLAKKLIIKKGERIFTIVAGSFIFGDLIEALIVEKNYHVKKMTISTLSMSENNVDSLANLINGNYVDELNLIVSAYFYSHERRNLIEYIYEKLDKENKFQLAVAGTHCKTCIFETHSGGFVVIHGSANLRSSANIEQIVIEENEQLYRFNEEYQNKIIEKYLTIKKPIRVNKLYNLITS